MKLRQIQKQKQILSQKQQQSVAILQMNALELSDYIRETALENPVMELEEREQDNYWEEKIKRQEWMNRLDEQNMVYYPYDNEENQTDAMACLGEDFSETLAEHLHFQLLDKGFSDWEMEVFDFIAQLLDEKGYFVEDMEIVCARFDLTKKEVEGFLDIMKELEPWGVCAGSLQECLLKQLGMKKKNTTLERRIVEEYLELVGKNQLHVIAKKLKVTIEEVKEACENIRELNPKPGRGFGRKEMLRYIEPDVIVIKEKNQLKVILNHTYPDFYVNQHYKSMMREDCAAEVKEYLKMKINQAEYIKDAIHRRQETLLKVVQCILEVQKDFFIHDGGIRMLRLTDVAEKLNVHESTISRAVKDKYIQCNRGLYALKHFFVRTTYFNETMEDLNISNVTDLIREIIQKEDAKKPYSDQKISDILNARGIDISRRTVTKYREAMHIPNGRERKVY